MLGRDRHVLLLPYPSQGHISPMHQFAKRLAAHDHHCTLALTRFVHNSTRPDPGPVSVGSISDGFDAGGFSSASSIHDYLSRLESVGSESLSGLIGTLRSGGRAVRVLVYDAFLPWARDVGERFGLRTAAFFTQSCAVDGIYRHVWERRVVVPATEPVRLTGLGPVLEPPDLPSFLSDSEPAPYPHYLALVLNQYKNLEKADLALINSFYELEPEEFDWMKSQLPVKSIGPTIPSTYLDNRIPTDSHYGFNLVPPDAAAVEWLNSKPPASVVYVSFGSMASLSPEQTNEIASALAAANKSFLWVVRTSELTKLPNNFIRETEGQGMVVTWCNQLDVLAHIAVGCFVTHCGWNSTMEGIGLGVPMVGMPQWTDQTTNAKYVEDVWRVGVRVRVKADEKGLVRGKELERCIKEVMDGEKSGEFRSNAAKWSKLAKEAVSEGGSSDKSILEFIDECCK